MRARLVLTLGAAVAVAAASLPAEAAPPTLDGKKVRKITKTAPGGVQDHDQDNLSLDPQYRTQCAMPRCYRLDFIYKPAKNVKGNILLKITWTNPASDFDLYFSDEKKAERAHCGGAAGLGEMLVVRTSGLKAGRKYTLVADFFRSVNDTVTATVEFPTKTTQGTTVPEDFDTLLPTNCVLDGTTPAVPAP
jgi:hypothetical protein